MIYIFNQEEKFEALLSNQNPEACPFWDAELEEVLQGEFTFTFTIPSFHEVAERIQEKWYVATKDPEGTYQLFIIQEIEDEHNEQATKTIFCEHAITELIDEIIEDEFIDRKKISVAVTTALLGTRWELGTVSEGDNLHTYTIRFRNVLEAIETILGRWQHEARFRVEIVQNQIQGRYIDIYVQRGTNTGKRFDFENDLKEIVRTVDARNVKTALWGRGKQIQTTGEEGVNDTSPEEDKEPARHDFKNIVWTVAGGDEYDKPLEQGWLGDEEARERWGKVTAGVKRHLFGVVVFDNLEDPEEILDATAEALKKQSQPVVSYKANAVDLYRITGQSFHEIRIGDTVKIVDHDLDIKVEARVLARKLDINFPELIEWTFGNIRPVFTNNFEQIKTNIAREVRNITGEFIERGDAIKTEWLEGHIDALRNEVLAGNGTVTMTEGDGILITDTPLDQNPTKALRLIGGVLAIANSKIQGSEMWDWKSFGTGDGFTADLMTAGTMKWDRSKGGLLVLGGSFSAEDQAPVNGVLRVLNDNDEVIAELDAERGGFSNLNVGDLNAQNVYAPNLIMPNYDDVTYYVGGIPDSSDDNIGRHSWDNSLFSIAEAINRIPKYNDGYVTINIGDYYDISENLILRGLVGGGTVEFDFNYNELKGYFSVRSVNQRVIARNGTVTRQEAGQYLIDNQTSSYFYVTNMILNGNGQDHGVRTYRSGNTYCENVEVYNVKECFRGTSMGSFYMINCRGLGTNTGVTVSNGAVAYISNTHPMGENVNLSTSVTSQIIRGASVADSGTATPPAPPIVEVTETWNKTSSKSWRDNWGWRTDNDYVYQGEFNGYGHHKGCWFFGSTMRNALNGKTIKRVRVYLTRRNHSGNSGSVNAVIRMHQHSTQPAGQPTTSSTYTTSGFSWGQSKWVTLPSSFHSLFNNGSWYGLAIYTTSTSNANYMIMDGSCKIEVTYDTEG